MNIGLFTSVFYNNIGNAFIDLGAEQTIVASKPQKAQLVKISQCPFFEASMTSGMMLKESKVLNWLWVKIMQHFAAKLHDKSYTLIKPSKVFNLVDFYDLDYMIIPGCVLTVPFVKIFGSIIKKISDNGVRIIYLGASGNYYSNYEIGYVTKYLERLEPYAIMTRDSKAFKYYHGLSKFSYNGIDNAFFVNRLNLPNVKSSYGDYAVLNFDSPNHYKYYNILQDKFDYVVRSNHKPFPHADIKKYAEKGYLISDTPLDYLLLYANAKEVHSDRVHACIPTLSFGNKCKLYSDSPRIALFESVGLENVTNEVVSISNLDKLQDSQIHFLESILL